LIPQERVSGKNTGSSKSKTPCLRDLYGPIPYDVEEIEGRQKAPTRKKNHQKKIMLECPTINVGVVGVSTHYCAFLANQYAMLNANAFREKKELYKLLSQARGPNLYSAQAAILDDVWAEWICDWNAKAPIIRKSRTLIERLLRSEETRRYCAFVAISHDSNEVSFAGNTFSFFVFPCPFMARRTAPYRYLDGSEEAPFEWWNMPAVLH